MGFTSNSILLAADCLLDHNFRDWGKTLHTQLINGGLVNTADTGQLSFDGANIRGSSTDISNSNTRPLHAMDGSTTSASGWKTTVAPTILAPQWLIYDAGVGNTFSPLSSRIFTNTINSDPKDITIDYADSHDPFNPGATTWTNAVTVSLASGTGNNNQNFTGGSHRFWRLSVTSTQGSSSNLQVAEWELWTAANGTGTKATLNTLVNFFSTGTVVGYKMYRFNDWYHANGFPVYIKIEYGMATTNGASNPNYAPPGIWISIGTATDGAGNITSPSIPQRQQIGGAGSTPNGTSKTAFCGEQVNTSQALSSGRVHVGLFTNHASFMWFVIERSKANDGKDNDIEVYLYGQSGNAGNAGSSSAGFFMHLPKPNTGAQPNVENLVPFNIPGTTAPNTIRGGKMALYSVTPFFPEQQNPLMGAVAYFAANAPAGVPLTQTMYGANHTVYPLGDNVTGQARAVSGTSVALRFE